MKDIQDSSRKFVYLAQKHVLGVFLSLSDLISEVLHLGILGGVGVDLVLQLLVLV